jgi:hypothetical protein
MVAAVLITRPSGWMLLALGVMFLSYTLIVEHLRYRMLLAVFSRAPSGTLLSLDHALGVAGMRVMVSNRRACVCGKVERGPTADSE